jgi:hypothetical protein
VVALVPLVPAVEVVGAVRAGDDVRAGALVAWGKKGLGSPAAEDTVEDLAGAEAATRRLAIRGTDEKQHPGVIGVLVEVGVDPKVDLRELRAAQLGTSSRPIT